MSTTQPLAPSPRRENCFDALRLFAALTVMIFHVVTHFQAPFLWVTIENQAWFLDGVPLFFILSGLLIYQSLDRCQRDGRPLNQFYVNRFLRVAPAIYVYAPIAVVTLLLAGALQWKALISLPFLGWLVSTYLLVPVYHPTTFQSIGVGVLNGSLWTIPAECGFYLIAPLLLRLERRWGFQAFIIALGVVALAMHALYIGLAMHSPEALTTVADGGKARKFDGDTRFCETAGEIAPSFGHDLPGLRLSTCYDSPGSGGFVFDRRRLFSLAAARS